MHLLSTPKKNSNKHIRRTATGVMAGTHDSIPVRDVLTSLLNGVGRYGAKVEDEAAKQKRRQEKKELKREEKRKMKAARARQRELAESLHATADGKFASTSTLPPPFGASEVCKRPTIHIRNIQRARSVSVSEPPSPIFASTPGSTPGPSHSSSTSRTSSKRPHTPDDDELLVPERPTLSARPRKKRAAAKKGWKGWVEGSPPPSKKLINLDAEPELRERKTRSGKNFDGVGLGMEGWV
ncbi:hypothetical protein M413DRAFT_440381 [Hebeloma cylindrosporum]|uniref:Uncharacterized protein n=1 Tax=Hebeloma cylindrosporum TaxID=76867 RepID=A0A0C3CSE0_HEBCY|nr:hypothetical protein M413DRAFT_440381 [Hebeloma cylindrosporum h7]